VIEEIAIGGTHRIAPFRRPSSGAPVSLHITPGVPLRSTPSCSSAALHCRLYSAAPSALFSVRPAAQRQRRAGVKPGVKRSGTPRNDGTHMLKTPDRGWRRTRPNLPVVQLK
jgi:hypothetical protein